MHRALHDAENYANYFITMMSTRSQILSSYLHGSEVEKDLVSIYICFFQIWSRFLLFLPQMMQIEDWLDNSTSYQNNTKWLKTKYYSFCLYLLSEVQWPMIMFLFGLKFDFRSRTPPWRETLWYLTASMTLTFTNQSNLSKIATWYIWNIYLEMPCWPIAILKIHQNILRGTYHTSIFTYFHN